MISNDVVNENKRRWEADVSGPHVAHTGHHLWLKLKGIDRWLLVFLGGQCLSCSSEAATIKRQGQEGRMEGKRKREREREREGKKKKEGLTRGERGEGDEKEMDFSRGWHPLIGPKWILFIH